RGADVGGGARPFHLGEPFELAQPALLVHLVTLDLGRLFVGLEGVDADDRSLARCNRVLHAERLLGDEALEVALLDRLDHAAAARTSFESACGEHGGAPPAAQPTRNTHERPASAP